MPTLTKRRLANNKGVDTMFFRIDGRSVSGKEMVCAMEKLGVFEIEINLGAKAKLALLNSITDEIKEQLYDGVNYMPNWIDYTRAYDLLAAILERVRQIYEHEPSPNVMPSYYLDARQIPLFQEAA